ncbi:MAG: pseudaminic acid synthase [Muribaculaceae bacterium]|nr:pseudaminic acid synthase [Muribaculaceae bacterium]
MAMKIVAELSANHNGSLATAVESIHAIAEAGADAVKLQTYKPQSLTLDIKSDDFLLKGGLWDNRYLYELYQEAQTPYEWHAELYETAHKCGLECFSTPFDRKGVDLLETLDNPIYKIASFEIADLELIRYAARLGKPMVLSTGIASARELEEAVSAIRKEGNNDITLLKCTSAYPARVEDAALGQLKELQDRYAVKVGVSDHSPGYLVPVLAAALGSVMVEKHFILDRKIGGADAEFSMDFAEFREMVKMVRTAEAALDAGKGIPEDENPDRGGRKWGRSIYVKAPIAAGEEFSEENIAVVRPGFSMHPRHLSELLGRRARGSYSPGDRIPESEL